METDIVADKQTRIAKKDILFVLNFAWPAVLEAFCIELVGMIDTYMVSGLDAAAVAAVGLASQPKFIALSFFNAIKIALSAMVARRFGEKQREKANALLSMSLIYTIVGSLLVSAVFVAYSDPIMKLMGSQPDSHEYAVTYFRIIIGGMIFTTIPLVINAAQRGVGDTKTTMWCNIAANVVNVIGNYLLIEGHLGFPALGIAGAAIATVFGKFIATVMSIIAAMNKEKYINFLFIMKNRLFVAKNQLRTMVKMGTTELAELLLMRVGLLLSSMMVANLGTEAMAAHQVGLNASYLAFAFGSGLSAASVALTGRYLGEKRVDKAKMSVRICIYFGLVLSVVLSAVYLLGGRGIYQLFFAEETIVRMGVQIMRVMTLIIFVQVILMVFKGSLRGAGDVAYVMTVGTVATSVIRPLTIFLLTYVFKLGIIGIWLGILVDYFIQMVLDAVRYRAGKWAKITI